MANQHRKRIQDGICVSQLSFASLPSRFHLQSQYCIFEQVWDHLSHRFQLETTTRVSYLSLLCNVFRQCLPYAFRGVLHEVVKSIETMRNLHTVLISSRLFHSNFLVPVRPCPSRTFTGTTCLESGTEKRRPSTAFTAQYK